MAKDPAINWYFDNWSGGTNIMSRHLKGCYMDLLAAQFHNGHLSLEEIKIVLGNDFAAWGSLSKKFTVDEAGKYFNERLDHEILKRKKFLEKQFLNGIKGGRPITQTKPNNNPNTNPNETLYETGIETGIEDFGKSENLLQNPKKEEVERIFIQQGGSKEMALAFFNRYEAVEWKIRGTIIKNFSPLVGNFIKNWNENKNGNSNHSAGNKSNRDRQTTANASLIEKLKSVTGASSKSATG